MIFRNTTLRYCKHDKIAPHSKAGYCPDCGEYVENQWYITRCKCCGIKQKSFIKSENIISDSKFCKNCGCGLFVIQKLESIDIVNINYAVLMKKTSRTKSQSFLQTWIEKNTIIPIKLLPCY